MSKTSAERKYTLFISAEYHGDEGREAEARFNITEDEVVRTLYEHDIEYKDTKYIPNALHDLKKRDDVFIDSYPVFFVVIFNGVNSKSEN